MHLGEPFSALYRQGGHTGLIGDVDRTEGPAVNLQCLFVGLGGVAGSLIVGVGLDDGGIRQPVFHQILYPGSRKNVWSFGLAGVKLNGDLAGQHRCDPVIDLFQSFCAQIASKKYDGLSAGPLLVGDVSAAVCSCNRSVRIHGEPSFWSFLILLSWSGTVLLFAYPAQF